MSQKGSALCCSPTNAVTCHGGLSLLVASKRKPRLSFSLFRSPPRAPSIHLQKHSPMAEVDPSTTLATLSSTLSTLESSLEPLLATPFETLCSATNQDGSELDPLLKARLEILTGYVVHDLIWSESLLAFACEENERELTRLHTSVVYCRTAGVDPNSHPVLAELVSRVALVCSLAPKLNSHLSPNTSSA